MIKLVSDTIDKEDIKALIGWLNQDEIPKLTKGELTWELERKWAEKMGTKYSVFVNSGSSAIFLTLLAMKQMGNLKNNKIVVPNLSWATDYSSPNILGFDIIFCDSNQDDLSLNLDILERIFKKEQPSAVILVSVLGLVPNMKRVVELCEKYEVLLLEDVCESMGSKYQGQYLGSFGYASFFSMYFGHHLSTIEGGFINTNDDDLYDSLLMCRSHGWSRDLSVEKQKQLRDKYNIQDEFTELFRFYVSGMNLRSTDLQAFLGLRAIDKLDGFAERRRNNFKLYSKYLNSGDNYLFMFEERAGDFTSSFAIPIIAGTRRDELISELKLNEIECRPLIAGDLKNHPMVGIQRTYEDMRHSLSNIIDMSALYVPNHQDLTEKDIKLICNIIRKVLL